jgi:hypothetical protein
VRIFYGKGAYRRANGNLPELKLINMAIEPSPVDEEGVVLISREGLTESFLAGSGPIRGVFKEDGVFGGDTFTVSGSSVYRGTTLLGTILGSGPVSFAASDSELGINAGGPIYRYDGTTFGAVTFPDSANVRKILYHDSLFFAVRDLTDEFYASNALDLGTWDALSFKSAESAPDQLYDGEVLEDALIWFGSASIEAWQNNGSGDTVPYSRAELSTIDKGIRATGCLVKMDQGLFFVSNENSAMVFRGGAPERVSDHGIEERLAASASCSCFGYVKEGHSFFCIRLADATFGYDLATSEWCEFATLGLSNFIVQCATTPGPEPLFGSAQDGKVYAFGGWTDDAYPLERRFTAGIPLSGGTLSMDALSIQANTGWTSLLSGQGSDPQVEMRSSRDGGATWGTWRTAPLGGQGDYRARSRWRRCGMFDEPGALSEFRCTDPVGFRMSGVFVNEQGGGRARHRSNPTPTPTPLPTVGQLDFSKASNSGLLVLLEDI